METNKILHVAAHAGRILLESGSEIYRAEETMIKICKVFGVKEADNIALPTGIMISVIDKDDKTYSLVKRISYRSTNLNKIDLVNDLSRRISSTSLTLGEVEEELIQIEQLKSYNNIVIIISAALGTGFFSQLFYGTIHDFISSIIVGSIVKISVIYFDKLKVNGFFINAFGGIIATVFSITAVHFGLGNNLDIVTISAIMLLVPGMLITNAIRDTIAGDLISGITRALEALFIAVAIALGSGLIFKIWFLLGGNVL